ncbi:MAG: OmpA family protein [Rubrivivax sp.]|nr:OmpA family protein [Rubrivivax sp.]
MTTADDAVDGGAEPGAPVWAVFGDLMAGLLGAFVLILVATLALQLDLATRLDDAVKQRQAEAQRRTALEQALAIPLAVLLKEGRVTLDNGRIGISSSLLFAFNSDQLEPEGRQLLQGLAQTLAPYLAARNEMLMVSGFTDDRGVRGGSRSFADNWELSAQRALTVTRALIDAGVPRSAVFAAAFGAEQPVAPNSSADGRALNRRVEITPTPRPVVNAVNAASAPAGR